MQEYARWRPHPWHGLDPGADAPRIVNAFIEITPFDLMKYEVDKASGYLRVDRPQRTSSQPPTLYGFIPQTYCGKRVASRAPGSERGDGDPLDICVISERPITRAEILLRACVVGGLRLIDRGEADDKIIAVLEGDYVWGGARELTDVPATLVERLRALLLDLQAGSRRTGQYLRCREVRLRGGRRGHRGLDRGLSRSVSVTIPPPLQREVTAETSRARSARHSYFFFCGFATP